MFAPVRPSTEVVGTLLPDIASEFGLPAECAVVVGTGDEHAASVGAGAIEAGVVVDVTGTAEPVTTVSATPVRDPLGLVETHGHAVPGSWLIENPGFVSGGSTLWLAGLLGVPQAEIFSLALAAPPASEGVLFLPALSGATAPRWNDRMRGGLLGLAMNHTPAHVARAVLEGCAFALRDIVERLDALGLGRGEVRIVGGGARDNLWATIKASVLGRPVRRVLTEEATAVGAAMVAGVGTGFFADFTAASVAVRLAPAAIDPDPEATKTYADAYRRYLAAFDAVESALAARPTCRLGRRDHRSRPRGAPRDPARRRSRRAARRRRPHRSVGVGQCDQRQRRKIRRERADDPQRRRAVPHTGGGGRGSARRAARLPGRPARNGDGPRRRGNRRARGGRSRGAPAAGLRRIRNPHGHREGHRAAHRQPSRRGPNRLQHQRFHRRPQRSRRRRRETHRPVEVARRPRRRHRHPRRGAVAVEPRWGGRSFDGPQRGRRVAARRPARSRTARTRLPSSTMSLPQIQSSLHSRGPRATPSRRVSPIWPGCWRPVDCRWESSVRRHRHRAPSMRSRT